jgi:hypothetical protein
MMPKPRPVVIAKPAIKAAEESGCVFNLSGDTRDPETLKSKEPFLVGIQNTPAGPKKIFQFPKNDSIGTMFYLGGVGQGIRCQGRQEVKPDKRLVYRPEGPALKHPEILRRFGKNDLFAVQHSVLFDFDDRDVEEICNLDGLQKLDLSNVPLTEKSLIPLRKLKQLKELNLSKTGINGSMLAGNPIMLQLTSLNVTFGEDMSPLWKYLAENNSPIKHLSACPNCQTQRSGSPRTQAFDTQFRGDQKSERC